MARMAGGAREDGARQAPRRLLAPATGRAAAPRRRGGGHGMTSALLHSPRISPRIAGSSPTPEAIGRAATLSLYDELALSPKPGLVTLLDRGSHTDMDAHTFMRSLLALRGYFARIATLGAQGAGFPALQACGIEAEAHMLSATGGINTHRGAIFMLGLLCAA